MRYIRYAQDAFNENGAEYFNMHLESLDATSLVSSLGVEVSTLCELNALRLSPRLGLSWRHEFEDGCQELQTSFSGYGDAPFTVRGLGQPRDVAVLQMGLDARFNKNLTAYLQGDARQGDGYSAAALYFGLVFSF